MIFYECIFYHDNGTICLIIHHLIEYYCYIYQLLKLFIFVAIYGAFLIVSKYGTILRKQLSRSAGKRETVKMMKQVKNGVDSNDHVDMDAVHMVAGASNS